jgi:hypothetical protein
MQGGASTQHSQERGQAKELGMKRKRRPLSFQTLFGILHI